MPTVFWPALAPIVTEEPGTRGGTHAGIDLAANRGDPVLAPHAGQIVYVGGDGASGPLWLGDRWLYPNGEGRTIDLRFDGGPYDGLISRVGHLEGYAVSQGDWVAPGQVIGYAGNSGFSTGVHIHWETRWDRAWSGGSWINPRTLNPKTFQAAAPVAPPKPKELTVIAYHREDLDARKKGRTVAPGAHIYLNTKSGGPANFANCVGGVGEYALSAHLYAEGKPGDKIDLTYIWQDKDGKNSPHYTETLVLDDSGNVRATRTFLRSVPSGSRVMLRAAAHKSNAAEIKVTMLDSDAHLYKAA